MPRKDFTSWLETVIYVLVDWSCAPHDYEYTDARSGQRSRIADVFSRDEDAEDAEDDWRFLLRGFYLMKHTDGEGLQLASYLHRLADDARTKDLPK